MSCITRSLLNSIDYTPDSAKVLYYVIVVKLYRLHTPFQSAPLLTPLVVCFHLIPRIPDFLLYIELT